MANQTGPAVVMAGMQALRAELPEVRAQVARIAAMVIAGRRRLRFLLGDARPKNALERARAYVRLSLLEAGRPLAVSARELPSAEVMRQRLLAISDDDQRFAVQHSIPDWLVSPLRQAFGDGAAHVLQALAEPAPRTLRINRLRVGTRQELIDRLALEGVVAVTAAYADTAVHVRGTQDLFQTAAYRDGCFEQQDEASQLAILATAPPKGGKILDLCCGSGGKTLGIASLLGKRGVVLASDVHEVRLRKLRQRLPRAGVDIVQPLLADGSERSEHLLEQFARHADRILIDAPCSGTGSWRRRPEARWLVDPDGLLAMQDTQRQLLLRAAQWLKPGARLVYATCSLLPAENEQQVGWLCEQQPDLEAVRVTEILGGDLGKRVCDATGTWLTVRPDSHGCDGFFLAVLRRRPER
jgi:16S rRNA (cytosine967-C5)-methyltransferase